MQNNLISIIVPVYNAEKTIAKCINSLIKQTYENIEIILIDDGSTDSSYEICVKYQKEDNRIKVVHQNNSGVSSARNYGLKICNGDYIGFVDSDDYLELTMYEKLYSSMEKNNCMLGICNYFFENPKGKNILCFSVDDFMFKSDRLPKYMIDYLCINGFLCNKLYKRELLVKNEQLLLLDENIKMLEDNLYNYYVYNSNTSFDCIYLDQQLYHYIQYENSTCNKKYDLSKLQYFVVRKKQIDMLEHKGENADFLKADYVFNFAKDQFKIDYLKLDKDENYNTLYNSYLVYLNSINIKMLSKRVKLKYIICKYFPFIIKLFVLLKKENI